MKLRTMGVSISTRTEVRDQCIVVRKSREFLDPVVVVSNSMATLEEPIIVRSGTICSSRPLGLWISLVYHFHSAKSYTHRWIYTENRAKLYSQVDYNTIIM